MKNVIIISSSPRINGNSDLLCQEFGKGAKEAHHQVEMINLVEKKINYCLGCYQCAKLGQCFQNDDLNPIAKKLEKADVIVFATPVYFYSMSGQLKVFFDRLVQNYVKYHADIYLMITAWDPNKQNLHSTVEALRGMTRDCMNDCPEKGLVIASGVTDKGEINNTKYLKDAYNLGLHC